MAGDLPVYYAGNLQGRHSRETGEKGALVVEAHARAPAEPRFVRFGPLRWARLRVENLPAEGSLSALVDHLAGRIAAERRGDFEELAICLELAGATPHARALRSPEERSRSRGRSRRGLRRRRGAASRRGRPTPQRPQRAA